MCGRFEVARTTGGQFGDVLINLFEFIWPRHPGLPPPKMTKEGVGNTKMGKTSECPDSTSFARNAPGTNSMNFPQVLSHLFPHNFLVTLLAVEELPHVDKGLMRFHIVLLAGVSLLTQVGNLYLLISVVGFLLGDI